MQTGRTEKLNGASSFNALANAVDSLSEAVDCCLPIVGDSLKSARVYSSFAHNNTKSHDSSQEAQVTNEDFDSRGNGSCNANSTSNFLNLPEPRKGINCPSRPSKWNNADYLYHNPSKKPDKGRGK